MASAVDAVVEWVKQAEEFLDAARKFLSMADDINRYFGDNDIAEEVLAALAQGQETPVGGSHWTGRKAGDTMALMYDFLVWRKGKLSTVPIIDQDGNPVLGPDGTPLTIVPSDITRQKAIVNVKVS